MAFGANTIFDVRNGAADTNGGAFDPGATLASTNGTVDTNTGNTAAPVFQSADYTFVTGDILSWVYIKSGTNSIPGWYQVASVAGGKATLTAGIGTAIESVNNNPVRLNTAAGIATVGTPTSLTWTMDYSQQTAANVTGTASSSGTTLTATTAIFHKGMVGNFVTNGTNWAEITAYTSTTVVTIDSSPAWTTQAITIGGAFVTPGKAAGLKIAGNDIFWKYNASAYTLTTNSSNVAGGIVSDTTGGVDQTNLTWWVGWDTTRTLYNSDANWPTINAGSQNSITLFSITGNYMRVRNIIVDGNGASTTSVTGFYQGNSYQKVDHVKAQNCEVYGINMMMGNGVTGQYLLATGCSGTGAIRNGGGYGGLIDCEAWGNTTHGFIGDGSALFIRCISSGNTGTTVYGFKSVSIGYQCFNCIAVGNGQYGFDGDNSISNSLFINCIAEGNGVSASGGGWSSSAGVRALTKLVNCAGYNNTGGNYSTTNILDVTGFVAQSAGSFFTDAASGDFSLNNIAGRGALLRATGYPGVFPRGLTASALDIGASQHADGPMWQQTRIGSVGTY